MIEWEVDKCVKHMFGFNFFILVAWKLLNQKRTDEYCFLFVNRKRLDVIFVSLINSTKDMILNLDNIKDINEFSDLYSGICWINTQDHVGLFAPSIANKKQIDEAIRVDVAFYGIRNLFYQHAECLTFWGVVITIIALLGSICLGLIMDKC